MTEGRKFVYWIDKSAKPPRVLRYSLEELDAREAVRNHPDEYSFDPPADGKFVDVPRPLGSG